MWAASLCALLGCLLYLNTLDCQLCFDDEAAVASNMDLRTNASWFDLLFHDFWGVKMSSSDSHKSYRPLCVATFRLNYLVHGLEPMGYHLVNVVLHAVVCYLYVQLCGAVFTEVWPALIAGLLFAAHPIHTEAVAGVVGRAEILSGLLFISAILAYRRALKVGGKLIWLIPMVLSISSALSKETGITAVVLCISYEYFIHMKMTPSSSMEMLCSLLRGKTRHYSPFLWRLVMFSACTLTFLILRILLNQGAPNFSKINNPAIFFPSPYRQLHWSYLVVFNLQLLFFPSPLSAEYAMNTIPYISSFLDYRNIYTLAVLMSVFIFCYKSLKTSEAKRKPLIFALALTILPFLPASNLFFPVGFVVAERVLYLPSMGFCMLVGLGVWQLYQHYSPLIRIGLIYLLVINSAKTLVRNSDWYSDISLFQSAVTAYPTNAKMISNLGSKLNKTGDYKLATKLLYQAIRVEPLYSLAHHSLANLLREQGYMSESIKVFQQAADLVTRNLKGGNAYVGPDDIKVYNSLSNMLREHSDNTEAALQYALLAIQNEPDWENGYHSAANALVRLGRLAEAKVNFEKSLSINPKFSAAHSNYGDCLQKLGLLDSAEHHYRQALHHMSKNTLTKFRLASLIIQKAARSSTELLEAEQLLKDVLEVEPDNGNATVSLGVINHDLDRVPEAKRLFERALQHSPHDKTALFNLGVILATEERYEEAISTMKLLLSHHPNYANGWSKLGTCYMQTKQHAIAAKAFDVAMELDPNNTMALQNYGLLCMQEKKLAKALELFSSLHHLHPHNEPVRKQVRILEKALGQQRGL